MAADDQCQPDRKQEQLGELRPCCVCPETRKLRDECVLRHGPDSPTCQDVIRAHQRCLRYYGFS